MIIPKMLLKILFPLGFEFDGSVWERMSEMQEDPYFQGDESLKWEESTKKNHKYEKLNHARLSKTLKNRYLKKVNG